MFQTEIQCYRKHKNLKAASSELGVPLPTLYWRLKKAGEPVVGDKTTYGSDSVDILPCMNAGDSYCGTRCSVCSTSVGFCC